MEIRLRKIPDLTAADWSTWRELQQASGVYESPYFRPEFSQAVAAVRSDAEVAVLTENGRTVGFFPFQRGPLNLGKPIGGKLSDYHGPLVAQGGQRRSATVADGVQIGVVGFRPFRQCDHGI